MDKSQYVLFHFVATCSNLLTNHSQSGPRSLDINVLEAVEEDPESDIGPTLPKFEEDDESVLSGDREHIAELHRGHDLRRVVRVKHSLQAADLLDLTGEGAVATTIVQHYSSVEMFIIRSTKMSFTDKIRLRMALKVVSKKMVEVVVLPSPKDKEPPEFLTELFMCVRNVAEIDNIIA